MSWRERNFAQTQLRLNSEVRTRKQHDATARRNQTATARFNEAIQLEFSKINATEARTESQLAKRKERMSAAVEKEKGIAEAEAKTEAYEEIYAGIDSILQATLEVDDFVDLRRLKTSPQHPPFDPGVAGRPGPEPNWVTAPDEPIFTEPKRPNIVARIFGASRRHEEEVQNARARWEKAYRDWHQYVTQEILKQNRQLQIEYERREERRKAQLALLEEKYELECSKRDAEVALHNQDVDLLISEVRSGTKEAVEEYIQIVLANSAYPEYFTVDHNCVFHREEKELELFVTVPEPRSIPVVKNVKYIASKREERVTDLSVSAQKNRFNNAVYATALRSIHEVLEADRGNVIATMAVTVQVQTDDPTTGHRVVNPLVLVACERNQFSSLKLENVEPIAALRGLRAILSKNPFECIPAIADGNEVRR